MKTIGTLVFLCICVAAFAADSNPGGPATAAPPAAQGHWAYQPVQRPEAPAVKQKDWVKSRESGS